MMKKGGIVGVIIILLLVVLLVWSASQYATGKGERAQVLDEEETIESLVVPTEVSEETTEMTGEQVPINKKESSFEFEGFSVAKNHVGTFDEWDGFLIKKDNQIVGGEGAIQVSSVDTGIDRLNTHLQSADFFNAENNPEITFKATNIEDGIATGVLSFHGISKRIAFPVTVTEDSMASEFFLDVTPFKFKYTGINPEVRIKFGLKL